jgi:probable F420-dependent oxidoreductase
MRDYLAAMGDALYMAPRAETEHVVLAALGPKMLELAASAADGAHPYFVPVEHTDFAREHLGPDALLAPEQAAVLSTDPEEARAVARGHMATYLGLPNYTNNLRRFGWGDEDLADGGSDALVDAIVAWGDEQAILDRVREHHDRGADHVALQVLPLDGVSVPMDHWRRLSEALDLT